jgi:CRISPR-associated protein (TIGR02710 family)
MSKPETAARNPGHILLVCTVGGSPEPLIESLRHWRPSRVFFVASPESGKQVESQIVPGAAREADGFVLSVGAYDVVTVPDAQDFSGCVRRMRELAGKVQEWLARGEGFEVVVDFTGGTKCMTAALALLAHPWGCRFSYIGGTERTKDSVGVVVSGREQVLHFPNPWASLGHQAVEDALALLNSSAYAGAAGVLGHALQGVIDPARKRELASLRGLALAYEAWDRFDHREAARLMGEVAKNENDLRSLLGSAEGERIVGIVARHRELLLGLAGANGPTWDLVADLLANAIRRGDEGRHDDAVARLYRAIEAMAQTRLREAQGVEDTSRVKLEMLPATLQAEFAPRAVEGLVRLGLQDSYSFLREKGDPIAQRFTERRLDDWKRSNLTARNGSILAHGFQPVGEKVYRNLLADALALAEVGGVMPSGLPQFPRLGIGLG